ncbi:hypothetical protein SPHINGO391_500189 [Sphingomonas aurantiaca]|uniref:Uncharacterized protein n=1 Tax=Sphingomonas aurantiaca TaxID=185949 RepID=A0A5E8ABX1_9SPHN|nr:hypothetical protein SPHINGO391_500189 [Sphingomonas aurantiaca]
MREGLGEGLAQPDHSLAARPSPDPSRKREGRKEDHDHHFLLHQFRQHRRAYQRNRLGALQEADHGW